MSIDGPVSKLIESKEINGVFLTLASWETYYGKSYEVGYRHGGHFDLIQFRTLSSVEAFDIICKLVEKGKTINRIQEIMRWIDDR